MSKKNFFKFKKKNQNRHEIFQISHPVERYRLEKLQLGNNLEYKTENDYGRICGKISDTVDVGRSEYFAKNGFVLKVLNWKF